MSENNIVLNTGQQAIINYDTTKIFLWDNRYENANYTNSTYDPITLDAGTLMGRISATGAIVPLTSGASNGSQFPYGILNQTRTIAAGATVSLAVCVGGDVAKEKVIFQGSDTFATVVSGKRLDDRIAGDTLGIKLVAGTQLTGFDNQ